jgi:microsomal dipeptidase-like Zn-dependent dipeptidase
MADGLRNHVQEITEAGGYPSDGLSFDFNGFAGGPRPRFGESSGCSQPQPNPMEYPFTSYDGAVTFEQPHLGDREVDFDNEGMLHIGLLPELIEDARRNGVTDEDLEPLFRSAEAYIRMWERAEARGRQLSGQGE